MDRFKKSRRASGRVEALESRVLLSATLANDVFAQFQQEASPWSARMPVEFRIGSPSFNLAGGKTLMGFEVVPTGIGGIAGIPKITGADGRSVSPTYSSQILDGRSMTIVDLPEGKYQLHLRGNRSQSGYVVNVTLAGDVDGRR